MMKWMLAAGAAALAISTPALADKGGHGGKGQGGQQAQGDRGGGQKQQKQGGSDRAGGDRSHGQGQQMRFAGGGETKQKGGGHQQQFARNEQKGGGHANAQSHGPEHKRTAKVEYGNANRVVNDRVKMERGVHGRDLRVVSVDHGREIKAMRVDRDFNGVRFVPHWGEHGLAGGFLDGCPPGLAKKNNGCLPPGQAKKIVGTRLSDSLVARTLGWPYRQWYRDDDNFMYRWDDDYIYRVRRDNDLIDALFPYANRDYYYYPVGAPYPDYFNYYNVPYQYQSFYPDGGDNWYRYGDGAIYMVDPQTQMISGIAALLTGTPFGVGQPLPPSYGVYNVPYAYRDQYYDTPDAWYRYNDGYIYRVDPTTQLITAIISAIV